MHDEAATEHPEQQSEGKGKESKEHAIPKRCKDCDDLDFCDTDFCIHWWH